MSEPRDVDWAVIRREYETTDVSDQALAQRWGYKSANTVQRRRIREGWTRHAEAVAAALVTRAVAGMGRELREDATGGQSAAHTPHTHPEGPQNKGLPPSAGQGVCAFGAKTARRSPAPAPPAPPPAAAHTGREAPEQVILDTAMPRKSPCDFADLASIRVAAIRRQLGASERMIRVGEAMLAAIETVLTADPSSPAYWRAKIALGAVNRDKDTISSLTKSAGGMIAEGVKVERDALGMQAVPEKGSETPAPSGLRPEDVLPLLGVSVLAGLGAAAAKAATMRPALMARTPAPVIDGVAVQAA